MTTIQESMLVQKDLFAAVLEFHEPKRIAAQVAHESNPVTDFVSWGASFQTFFSKFDDAPMEKWGRDKLETFVRTTEPIVEQHQKARAML